MRALLVCSFVFYFLHFSVSAAGLGESGQSSRVDLDIQGYLSRNLATKVIKTFEQNVEKSRSKQRSVEDLITSNPYTTEKLVQRAEGYLGLPLPRFEMNEEGVVWTQVGKYSIHFTSESLFEGHIYLNQKPLQLVSFHPDRFSLRGFLSQDATTWFKYDSLEKLMNLFIPIAHADEIDRFEVLIISTVMAIKDDFDTSWCLFGGCRADRAQRNFDLLMKEIQGLANQCQSGDTSFNLDRDIHDFPYSQMTLTFEDRLKHEFNRFPQDQMSCQHLVDHFHKSEIENIVHRTERRGYIGTDSYASEQNKKLNRQNYENFIQDMCRPYVELRNCLIDRHGDARYVHDRERGSKHRGEWRDYSDEYVPSERPTRSRGLRR